MAEGAHPIPVLDGAGCHGTATTRRPRGRPVVPEDITLLHLPASSPEPNPMEPVQCLRQNKLANRM